MVSAQQPVPSSRVVLLPQWPSANMNADGGAAAPGAPPFVVSKTAPDPQAMVTKSQWVFDLRWDRGSIYLLAVHPLELPTPQATPRVMGRFAIELYEGAALIERARFDFPMLGGGEGTSPQPDAGTRRTVDDLNRVSFDKKLVTRIGVIFPQTRRGTRLDLVDRATGMRLKLPWPPLENPAQSAPAASGSERTPNGAR
ncbi:MAG: hypothetical protein ABI183_24750 [Polyangiaceae bacterium]